MQVKFNGIAKQTPCATLAWEVTYIVQDIRGIQDGEIELVVSMEDVAENASPEVSTTVLKDTVLPTVTIDSDLAVITSITQDSYPVRGTCSEVGQRVDLGLGDPVVTVTGTCDSDQTWSIDINASSSLDGNIALTATHYDAAGNSQRVSGSVEKDSIGYLYCDYHSIGYHQLPGDQRSHLL